MKPAANVSEPYQRSCIYSDCDYQKRQYSIRYYSNYLVTADGCELGETSGPNFGEVAMESPYGLTPLLVSIIIFLSLLSMIDNA